MLRLIKILLPSLIFFASCADLQIGKAYLKNEDRPMMIPIRQLRILKKGDCLINSDISNYCLFPSPKDVCFFYMDMNNNGEYDSRTDAQRTNGGGFCKNPKDMPIKTYSPRSFVK